jgi:hypothetical protein
MLSQTVLLSLVLLVRMLALAVGSNVLLDRVQVVVDLLVVHGVERVEGLSNVQESARRIVQQPATFLRNGEFIKDIEGG